MSKVSALPVRTDSQELQDAFPNVDPGIAPYGTRVLVQIRTAKAKSAGGILLHNETKETEKWNTQVAKVIALGPVAFANRDTLKPWPEGNWCSPGEYVRVPKYGGDRWEVPVPGRDGEPALFAVYKDLDIIGSVTGDPLAIVAFI